MKRVSIIYFLFCFWAYSLGAEQQIGDLVLRAQQGEEKVIPELLREIWSNEDIEGAYACISSKDRALISAFKWKYSSSKNSLFKDKISILVLRAKAEFLDEKGSSIPPSSSSFRENLSTEEALLSSLKKHLIIPNDSDLTFLSDHS